MVDAAGDWGPSDPVTLHEAIFEMRRRGHREADIETIFFDNPARFFSQSPKFTFRPRERERARAGSGAASS
jgi:predicted metal-dependent phosphotriesterase family hydrolase